MGVDKVARQSTFLQSREGAKEAKNESHLESGRELGLRAVANWKAPLPEQYAGGERQGLYTRGWRGTSQCPARVDPNRGERKRFGAGLGSEDGLTDSSLAHVTTALGMDRRLAAQNFQHTPASTLRQTPLVVHQRANQGAPIIPSSTSGGR